MDKITKDPNLAAFLNNMNEDFLRDLERQRQDTKEQIEILSCKIEENSLVELTNGETKKHKITHVLPVMYSDLKEIKSATDILVDANKVHTVFKKRKLYPVILFLFAPPSLVWIWQQVLHPLLKLLHLGT